MIDRLRALPLFARLADPELADLATRVRLRSFRRSEVIFRKDDPGMHLYLVLDGAVKIALPGELALFDRTPRSATAAALEDTRVALLASDDFFAFLERHPGAVRVVFEALARIIRRLSDRVEDLTFLDVPSRVAKYLLDLTRAHEGPELELALTQYELAGFVGASRVSVNRVLSDLERREIVDVHRRRITIKDPDRLSKEVRF